MKHTKRLKTISLLAAAAMALGLGLLPFQADAAAKKAAAKHSTGKAGAKSSGKPGSKASAKSKPKLNAKAGGKHAKVGAKKVAGPTVISTPAPPVAMLARLPEARIQTGCLALPVGAGSEAQLGVTALQLQVLVQTAAQEAATDASSTRCAPYAAVAFAGSSPATSALAFLPSDDRRALIATRLQADIQTPPHWQDLEADLPVVREVWLQSQALLSASADGNDLVPAYLMHELGLLVKHMRKQSGAGEAAMVRALIQGEDEEANLAAVELVDPATGQALDSVVWVARDGEPGAYISSRGVEYERMLWQAPVDFRRISRGIGASSMLVHKRVRVTLKAKKGKKPRSKMVVRAFQYKSQHIGIDFAAATGTPVVSVAEGDVVFSGWRGGYGNLVVIQHGSETTTHYGHLSAFAPGLQEGAHVRRGQEIGLVGSTGFSTGPHLHFEIRKNAKYMDPANPMQTLPVWTMLPQEHETVLTRLLQLEVTRAQSFMRTARAQQLAQPAVGQ
jgi:murein DD-endopeptidase MepM/ murein hydrolase activator NlpD